MSAVPASGNRWSLRRLLLPILGHPKAAQVIKWTVYSALVINFFIYLYDDIVAFRSALPDDAPWSDVLEQFSTTIDMAAWLGLVFLFELETYQLPDEKFKDWVPAAFIAARMVCYLSIGYAAYGYTAGMLDYYKAQPEPGLTSLCQVADQGRYFQQDVVRYAEITAESCGGLSTDSRFFRIPEEVALMDRGVMEHNRVMRWVDVINAFVWLIVVFLIEVEVWLQSADRFGSRALPVTRATKTFFYLVLIGNAIAYLLGGYPIYTWDCFLWIFGFWAIELNLAEWERDRTLELSLQGT